MKHLLILLFVAFTVLSVSNVSYSYSADNEKYSIVAPETLAPGIVQEQTKAFSHEAKYHSPLKIDYSESFYHEKINFITYSLHPVYDHANNESIDDEELKSLNLITPKSRTYKPRPREYVRGHLILHELSLPSLKRNISS